MWGDMFGREIRPQHVQTSWHFAADFMPNFTLTVRLHLPVTLSAMHAA